MALGTGSMAPTTAPPTSSSPRRIGWLLMLFLPVMSTGFQGPSPLRLMKATGMATGGNVRGPSPRGLLPSTSTGLLRSDIPSSPQDKKSGDSDSQNTADDEVFFRFELPPPPEDQLVLVGDLVSIFVYCFSDHLICHDLAIAQSRTVPSDSMLDLPVWLDASHSFAPAVLGVLQDARTVTHYSPLLEHAGLAACVLSTGWLLGGWLQGAFLTRNTLDCRTSHALGVTGRAWLVSCAIVLWAVAAASMSADLLLGSPLPWIGFSKGDADLVIDSLVVLALWRWLVSSLLGGGGGRDDRR